jgi:ABC-2 type transport system ATP-binding protein
MKQLGKKQLTLHLQAALGEIPAELDEWHLKLLDGGCTLEYTFDANVERKGIASLLRRMSELGIGFKDLNTRESSLEEIFVDLVSDRARITP